MPVVGSGGAVASPETVGAEPPSMAVDAGGVDEHAAAAAVRTQARNGKGECIVRILPECHA